MGWSEADRRARRKGELARELRSQTTLPLAWIAERLSGFDITFSSNDPYRKGDVHDYKSLTPSYSSGRLTGIWEPDGRNIDPSPRRTICMIQAG